jgi:hypothetical protein
MHAWHIGTAQEAHVPRAVRHKRGVSSSRGDLPLLQEASTCTTTHQHFLLGWRSMRTQGNRKAVWVVGESLASHMLLSTYTDLI